MSDTSGATDLDNDMPGIGAATGIARGSPVQLPSALQGLVQHFRQSSGTPNPKFLPPKPGPGGQPPQEKQPPIGSTDTPDRSAYAYAPVPANRPRPPPSFTPFVQSMPRDQSQWGQPEAFPRLPQSFELPGIYQKLGQFFGQNGSFASAPLGAGMAAYSAAYQDAFQKGQEWKMKMAAAQMKLHREQLADIEDRQATEYADIYNEHGEMGGDGTVGGVSLHDDVWKKAVELGDKPVVAMLEDGASAEKVRRFLMDREARLQDLKKANTKAETTDAEAAAFGLTPRSPTGATDPFHRGPTQPETPAADPAQTTATPVMDEEENNVVRGYEPSAALSADVKKAAVIGGLKKIAKLDQIIADPNIKPEDIVPTVRRELGPGFASELQNYMDYRKGPGTSGQGQGGKEQEYWNRLGALATKAKPGDPAKGVGGWSQSTYQAVKDFREGAQKPTSPIQRIPTSVNAAENVRRDLKAIQDRDGSTADVSPETLSGATGKDPLYAQLKIDWIRYNEDIDVLTRGSPSVGMAEQAINTQPQIPYFGSLSGYRAAVRRDMDQAKSRVDQLHQTWNSYGTGDAMPGYNPGAEKSMADIAKMDFTTGAVPGEVVTHPDGTKFRYLGVNPETPDARENWEIAR